MPRRAGFRAIIAAGLAGAGLLLAGCTQTVSGHAAAAGGSGSPPRTDFPSSGPTTTTPHTPTPTHTQAPPQTSPPPASHLACPHVVDPSARLGYDCVSTGMTQGRNGMWPVDFARVVDTGWTMDEGSGLVSRGGTPAATAKLLTQEMLQLSYGEPVPTSKTVHDEEISVGSAQGHLVQTLITINPTFRSQRHLRVKQEQLWLVVVPVSAGQQSAWYVSVPDLEKQLWPTVPALLKTLRVV